MDHTHLHGSTGNPAPRPPQPHRPVHDLDEPDGVLVKAVQAGDVSAFGQLFERHFTSVRAACVRRLDNPHDGEEVAQAAMVKALERIGQCRGERMFGPWVHIMAQRMCTDTHRDGARTRSLAELLAGAGSSSVGDPESDVLAAERRSEVWRALDSLPPRQRQVVIARDIHEQRPPEIAAGLGMSTGAVDSLLMRARRRLAAAYATGVDPRRRAGPFPLAGALLLEGRQGLLRRVWRTANHLRHWTGIESSGNPGGQMAAWATKTAVAAVIGATTSVLVLPGLGSSPSSPVPVAPSSPASSTTAGLPPGRVLGFTRLDRSAHDTANVALGPSAIGPTPTRFDGPEAGQANNPAPGGATGSGLSDSTTSTTLVAATSPNGAKVLGAITPASSNLNSGSTSYPSGPAVANPSGPSLSSAGPAVPASSGPQPTGVSPLSAATSAGGKVVVLSPSAVGTLRSAP
ncbi:MAG: RNA polymerase sigma factor [Acidimicrobiales bacterium]